MSTVTSPARCTICIPTYRQAEFVGASIATACQQSVPVAVMVSNDASPDNTPEILSKLQATHQFQTFNHQINRGVCAHVHWLLQQPQTEFIVRLDSDDLLHEEFVHELMRLLDRHPAAGYAHCAVHEIDKGGERKRIRSLGRTKEFEPAEKALKKAISGYRVSANIVMFRRRALEDIYFGANSEKLNFVEDYDLSIRMADKGWGNAYSNKILASYRVWTGASRPAIARQAQDLLGLAQIFDGSFADAFARRGWNDTALRKRRWQLAAQRASVLSDASLTQVERSQLLSAIQQLAGQEDISRLLSHKPADKALRSVRDTCGNLARRLKQTAKAALLAR